MRRPRRWFPLVLTLPLLVAGCDESAPILGSEDGFPVQPETVELRIPFSRFASDLRVVGGFGSVSRVGVGVLAEQGEFTSRVLLRMPDLPLFGTIRGTDGVTRPDSITRFTGGELVLQFDSTAWSGPGPLEVEALRMEAGEWDPGSATWSFAVDSLGDRRSWPEPGGGAAQVVGSALWDPAGGDSIRVPLDSAVVAVLATDTVFSTRGLRLQLSSSESRARLLSATLRLDARPVSVPDSLVRVTATPVALTSVYDPSPEDPADGRLRVGGAPAWRSYFNVTLPSRIEPGDPLCTQVRCPAEIRPEAVVYAALLLRSRAVGPAFQPADTLIVDVRPVLAPELVARSPVGNSYLPFGAVIAPGAFGPEAGGTLTLPVTRFVRDLVTGPEEGALPPPASLVLLSPVEPLSFEFGEFAGAGGSDEPVLRILLTTVGGVRLP